MRAKLASILVFCMSITSTNLLAESNTATLSSSEIKQTLVDVYQKYKNVKDGKNADYIPELAKVNPNYFTIVIATPDGKIESIGNSDVPFAIESISKPFVYGLALQDNGTSVLNDKIGLNATGQGFNSIMALEQIPNHLENPLVNAGAIQVTSLIKGKDGEDKWNRVLDFFKSLSDDQLYLGEKVYRSEMATNQHNRAIAGLLNSYGMLDGDPLDAVDRYTKACSIMASARQLALMGATLINKGINPLSHQQIIQPQYIKEILAQMVINGLYENSGAWFTTVGLPAKSGVGGGILAIAPHKMAIVVFSPPVDKAGNSVRAQLVIAELSKRWKLHLLSN